MHLCCRNQSACPVNNENLLFPGQFIIHEERLLLIQSSLFNNWIKIFIETAQYYHLGRPFRTHSQNIKIIDFILSLYVSKLFNAFTTILELFIPRGDADIKRLAPLMSAVNVVGYTKPHSFSRNRS